MRSARPRVCTTAVSVVAVVRSTRPVTPRASQPSPSRPRVPTSTWVPPCSRWAVTWRTQCAVGSTGPRGGNGSDRRRRRADTARLPASAGSLGRRGRRNACSVSGAAATVGRSRAAARGGRRRVLERARSSAATRSRPAGRARPRSPVGSVAAARSWSHSTSSRSRSRGQVLGRDDLDGRGGLALESGRARGRRACGRGVRPAGSAGSRPTGAPATASSTGRRRTSLRSRCLAPSRRSARPSPRPSAPTVLLAQPGAVGQRQQPGVVQPQRRVGQLRVAAASATQVSTSAPGRRSARSSQTRNGDEPNAGSVSAVVSSAKRSTASPSQSPSSAVGVGQPGQLGERREVALADHGRDRRAEGDGAEQLVDQRGLRRGSARRAASR